MSRKIIGVTVGTPTSPRKMGDVLKPVKTVNGKEPDNEGNVKIEGIPNVTSDDNGKIMQVVNGALVALELADSSVKTYIDDYISSALGGDY